MIQIAKKNRSPVFFILILIHACLVFFSCSTPSETIKDGQGEDVSEVNKEKVVVSEFILGPNDEIAINVYRHDDLNKKVQILPDGAIFLPLIGEVQAKGVSIRQLRDKITDGYSAFVVNPQVSVEVTSFKGQKVYVLGEVRNPGVYQIDPPMTIIEAVSKAGGITLDGKDESVLLIRGGMEKPELKLLDLEKVQKKGDLTQNVFLQKGDIIYVPRTFISDVDRFFRHFENIVRPIVILEQGIAVYPQVRNVVTGKEAERTAPTIIITPP